MTLSRVAVIGAGIAGLAAARRLAAAGLEVALFDKARRPGGRLSTRRAEGFAFDHGAQYFTCRDPGFERAVKSWCARDVAARWEAGIVELARGRIREPSGSTARYVGTPGMSALARDLAAKLRVECGRRVERLERGPGGWRVIGEDGSTFVGFHAVLVALPSPQAAVLLAPLPELARRVAAQEMQPCHAAMVAFAEPLGLEFGGAFVRDSPLSWVARNGSKPGRGAGECWVLQSQPQWSAAHLDAAPATIDATLLGAFAAALGRALPATRFHASHRWLYARPAKPLGESFLWEPEALLGVCGDWCLGGRVEGAYLSGDRLARQLLAEHRAPRHARIA